MDAPLRDRLEIIGLISGIIPMYQLNLEGLKKAARHLTAT